MASPDVFILIEVSALVMTAQMIVGLVCDFCDDPRAYWVYPSTNRDWMACDDCHDLIELSDWGRLLMRRLRSCQPRLSIHRDRNACQGFIAQWALFATARTGPSYQDSE